MSAIFKHELRTYFHSLTAYLFGALLLVFIGVFAMLYNIQAAVSNFELVFHYGSLIFVVIVPIMTMRVIAEERKQKTDQLLYSLPVTTTQVILGKYLALLMVSLVPLALLSTYPLIFSRYGDVYLPTSYGSLFAFFLVGAALLALGIFISSLTDNQGFAAGIGIAVILLNYFSVRLSEYVSSTAFGSVIVLAILILVLGAVVKHLTKNENLSFAVSIALMLILIAFFYLKTESFEGLLPSIMSKLSLFERLDSFIHGVCDVTAVVYYMTFIGSFLFLSVQSLEKRRYN